MSRACVLGIDQSTQGTKALLFDADGKLITRADLPHRQLVDGNGWVEHDPTEIADNTIKVVRHVVEAAGIDRAHIACVGISNQRETCVAWNKTTGQPVCNAIVWQCGRAQDICDAAAGRMSDVDVKARTGLNLSPYFSAAKLGWIMKNIPAAATLADTNELCCGTIDSWLVYKLTGGQAFKTDYSNASRTQLFNITSLQWDADVCAAFGVDLHSLPLVCDSDACFGYTDFDGYLPAAVPIHAVLGDSHAALYGQGCHRKGMVKSTYGTGSSVMMHIGDKPMLTGAIVTSLAWGMGGKVEYVMEGNLNYTGAIITWLKDDLQLIQSSKEVGALAAAAHPEDKTYLVPAFSGLGAPYWNSRATAILSGMTRTTGKNEIVRAAEEAIAYQIADILFLMESASGISIDELRVDGGPTRDAFLMQFQSDIAGKPVCVPQAEELSGIGAAYCAGVRAGVLDFETLFAQTGKTVYLPAMPAAEKKRKYDGWKAAIVLALHN